MDWIKNIAFYVIIMNFILNILSDHKTKIQVKTYMSILLIIITTLPILNLISKDISFDDVYDSIINNFDETINDNFDIVNEEDGITEKNQLNSEEIIEKYYEIYNEDWGKED